MRVDISTDEMQKLFNAVPNGASLLDIKFIFNTLNLFSCMRDSYRDLMDKSGIDEDSLIFPGFNLDQEREFLQFTALLIRRGLYRTTLGDKPRIVKTPVSHKYRRMVQCWVDLEKPSYPLNKKNIIKIMESSAWVPSRSIPASKPIASATENQQVIVK